MNKKYNIYKITNVLNNKIYIGQSKNPKSRWSYHKWYALNKQVQYIHRAMNKYGIENFKFEIIICCINDEIEADNLEAICIEKYKTLDKKFGYNLKPGGKTRKGFKHSEETKKMFKENWHIYHPPESVKRAAESHRGMKHGPCSEERKRKIGEANKISLLGKVHSPETIKKRTEAIAASYGNKICEAPGCERTDGYRHNGVRYCEMHIQRFIKHDSLEEQPRPEAWNKGIPCSDETKIKLSEALKGREVWNKGIPHTEEKKKKLSEILKGQEPPNKMKFSEEEIYKMATDPRGCKLVAEDFGVSYTVIKRIREENPKLIEIRENNKLTMNKRIAHNKKMFTQEEINKILNDNRSAEKIGIDFGTTKIVILRIRRENKR